MIVTRVTLSGAVIAGLVVGAVATAAAVAVLDNDGPATLSGARASSSAPATAAAAAGETGYADVAGVDGHLGVAASQVRCGVASIFGTHGEVFPSGTFCQAVMWVSNQDATFHDFLPFAQELTTVSGHRYSASRVALTVTRQPTTVTLGGRDGYRFTEYWDLPVGTKPAAIAFFGDDDPDMAGLTVTKAQHHPAGAILALQGP